MSSDKQIKTWHLFLHAMSHFEQGFMDMGGKSHGKKIISLLPGVHLRKHKLTAEVVIA